jgi:hypothetical protein
MSDLYNKIEVKCPKCSQSVIGKIGKIGKHILPFVPYIIPLVLECPNCKHEFIHEEKITKEHV